MKLFIITAAATLVSTAAFADHSTRYNDLRLDTSKTAEQTFATGPQQQFNPNASTRANDLRLNTSEESKTSDMTYGTRSAVRTFGDVYPYGGYGDGNDSR